MSRKPIPKKIREQVYKKYNGHCAYCGCKLEYKDMQVDHVISVYGKDGSNDLDNLYISIYSHVGGKYEYGKERNYSYGAFNGFDVELLRAVEQQMKELGWI